MKSSRCQNERTIFYNFLQHLPQMTVCDSFGYWEHHHDACQRRQMFYADSTFEKGDKAHCGQRILNLEFRDAAFEEIILPWAQAHGKFELWIWIATLRCLSHLEKTRSRLADSVTIGATTWSHRKGNMLPLESSASYFSLDFSELRSSLDSAALCFSDPWTSYSFLDFSALGTTPLFSTWLALLKDIFICCYLLISS